MTSEEKLRQLDRDIARQEQAVAVASVRPEPPKVVRTPISRRARLARRILAVSIGMWCTFCFGIVATGEGAMADPIGLAGLAIFMVLVGVLLYYGYLFQWALAREVAGWFRRGRTTDHAID